MYPYLTEAVAAEHRRDLLAEAEAYRMARAARHDRPRTRRGTLARWLARVTPAKVAHN